MGPVVTHTPIPFAICVRVHEAVSLVTIGNTENSPEVFPDQPFVRYHQPFDQLAEICRLVPFSLARALGYFDYTQPTSGWRPLTSAETPTD